MGRDGNQVNIMDVLNGNSLIEYVPCSMVRNYVSLRKSLWTEAVTTIALLENKLVTPNRDLSNFINFWDRKEKCSIFGTQIW